MEMKIKIGEDGEPEEVVEQIIKYEDLLASFRIPDKDGDDFKRKIGRFKYHNEEPFDINPLPDIETIKDNITGDVYYG